MRTTGPETYSLATTAAQDLLKAHPNLKGIFGITSVAFPAAALAEEPTGEISPAEESLTEDGTLEAPEENPASADEPSGTIAPAEPDAGSSASAPLPCPAKSESFASR